MDLAASVQKLTEEVVLRMANTVFEKSGEKNLCLAGGVALNCVANGRLRREGPFKDIWVQPAAGDAGGALGAAYRVWHALLDKPRQVSVPDGMAGSLLGPAFDHKEIQSELEQLGAKVTVCATDQEAAERTAQRLSEQAVVGWFQGPMEFGPRALGSRSILADPRNSKTQSVVNLKIKYRESFRPFAPCCLAERASELFEVETDAQSPYMLEVVQVRGAEPLELDSAALVGDEGQLGSALGKASETLPAITHVDGSARLQTVDERHPDLRRILQAFDELTGCPVLVNTSFNVRGEPIVHTPADAFRCFLATEMDVLVVGRCFLEKTEQQESLAAAERERYLASFELD